ncbi:tyrosine protein phosphatase [Paenibacillus pectinilyticus]|uniref:Tyrosine-protein phosphatase n=1 Tax=Paenibacillus pectinilyticus TaxID=512399 RepID=A0A1C0ZRJ4_9BACL|nr:CpsB/CapC family capsule biosynthesis tyrosine phosphatase [Paenibacillus pectinilyticus]OCT10693.1 tyrosine protein phosphatase [Paenibacillus pectinilyticus]
MIDIHSHILPELDDGASDLEESVQMARQAVKQGIHTVIATPHHENGRFTNDANFVEQQVHAFQEELDRRDIPLRIHSGQEIRVYRGLIDDVETNRTSTLDGTRYMLLEFPSDRISSGIHDLLHELQLMDIVPIIAHPERNREIAEDPKKLLELVQLGALTQVTAHSLLGHFGKSIQSFTFELCKNNLTHFVSSDAHNTSNRGFALAEAYEALRAELGQDYVNTFQNNANRIIHNLPIETLPPAWSRPKWFQFWKSK